MNKENLQKVVDALKSQRDFKFNDFTFKMRFDMSSWLEIESDGIENEHFCNTAGCIGGTAIMVHLQEIVDSDEISKFNHIHDFYRHYRYQDDVELQEWLGMSEKEINQMFHQYRVTKSGYTIPSFFDTVTVDQAIAVIEHYMKTGKVDWVAAGNPVAKAITIAEEYHGGQIDHLIETFTEAYRYSRYTDMSMNEILTATYLHDILSTDYRIDQLLCDFGPKVTIIVSMVTDPTGKELYKKLYGHNEATYLEVAYRLANLHKYLDEDSEFRKLNIFDTADGAYEAIWFEYCERMSYEKNKL